MRVFTTTDGKVMAEAQTVADVRKLLALDPNGISTARAVYAASKGEGYVKGYRGKQRTRTHSCGQKYKYLKWHLRTCPEAVSTPV